VAFGSGSACGLVPRLARALVALLRGRVHDVRTEAVAEAVQIDPAVLLKPGLVAALVLAGFLAGFPPPLVAAVGVAITLITRTGDPHLVYEEVDLGLLVFFIGLFLIVGGAENVGLTERLLGFGERFNLQHLGVLCLYARNRDPLELGEQRASRNAFEITRDAICRPSFGLAYTRHGQHACREPDRHGFRRKHHRCRTGPQRGSNYLFRLLSNRSACHASDAVVWLALAFLDSMSSRPQVTAAKVQRAAQNSGRDKCNGSAVRAA
jgi:hypothetical protein